ncbi:hypothetical protein [Methylobacterium pseudosasicola]|uniref:Uncharacterized protein n=1 Tax=Methylobacterium pseudosasicola TaxID=582667 RepID=A0A1I4QN23_9HYPH|nr:hypothetical protein [Methylobacterium pseudosasicola]SFM41447.1 hypothetical protein SAMN05192568_103077 [Methylobacterium pseudosasicola]
MSTLVAFLLILLAYRFRRWILVLIILALFAVCDHAPVQAPRIKLQAQTYTPEQLACSGEPPVPGRPRTAAAVGRYVGDLHAAWQDCHGALGVIREREQGSTP